jgi:hypothetical protein
MDLDTDIEVLSRKEISPTTRQLPIHPTPSATAIILTDREGKHIPSPGKHRVSGKSAPKPM